jgi:oligopeptide/dipeptide ABC transporter ATP-binding protein
VPEPKTKDALRVDELRLELEDKQGWLPVLQEVSLRIAPGEVVAVVGESGCGKSTLLRALIGLGPTGAKYRVQGRITLADTVLSGFEASQWATVRGARIGFVFQEPQSALNPTQTVLRQVEAAFHHKPRAQRRRLAEQALAEAGFPDPKQRGQAYAHELSGGLRQRVLLALALAQKPELVLADEPTAHLDTALSDMVLDRLSAYVRAQDASLVLVTHDLSLAEARSQRIYVMYAGRIVEFGPTSEVLTRPRHPYTAALLAAVPKQGRLPNPIPGEVPNLHAPIVGCAFGARCPRVLPSCREDTPAMTAENSRGWACLSPVPEPPC